MTNTALQRAAADRLLEMDKIILDQEELISERNAELSRIYEIVAVFHSVASSYLGSNPVAEDTEQQGALDTVADAVYAIEHGCTVDEAGLIRREELVE